MSDTSERWQLIDIYQRIVLIGDKISTRTIKRADDEIPAITIPVKGMLLDEEEVRRMFGSPSAYERLFGLDSGGVYHPALRGALLHLEGRVKRVGVSFKIPACHEFALPEATVSKLVLRPLVGGALELSCSVNSIIPEGARIDTFALLDALGKITFDTSHARVDGDSQPELPLAGGGASIEPPVHPDEDPEIERAQFAKGTERAIAAHKQRVGPTAKGRPSRTRTH